MNQKLTKHPFLLFAFLMVFAAGIMIAAAAAKPHQFKGTVKLICDPKGKENLASPTDVLTANVTIPFNAAGIGSTQKIESAFAWIGQSAKARSLNWHLAQPGSANVDILTGKIVLTLPFQATFLGKTFNQTVVLTTDTWSDAYGAGNGKRANPSQLSSPVILGGGGQFQADAKKVNPDGDKTGEQTIVFRAIVDGHFETADGAPFEVSEKRPKDAH